MVRIQELIGEIATKIAREIKADGIISLERLPKEGYELSNQIDVKVSIFKRVQPKVYKKIEYETKLRRPEPGSVAPLREALMESINKNYIQKGEVIVCVEDGSISLGYTSLLFVFQVDDLFFKMGKQNISENVPSEVLEAVVNIAKEIGEEGREGKKVGTAFIIGEPSEISKYLKQLIINPFYNLAEKVKITDPGIKETVKEFAQLDGAFIIDTNGYIVSCGTYIVIEVEDTTLPPGFGTKHRACAALTKETEAIAVTVSESGGIVRIIKEGRIAVRV